MPVKIGVLGTQKEGRQTWPDGEPIVVLRPLKRTETLALVAVAAQHNDGDILKEAVEGGPCELLGFLAKKDGRLVAVDENGENPVEIEQGDIMAAPSHLRRPS